MIKGALVGIEIAACSARDNVLILWRNIEPSVKTVNQENTRAERRERTTEKGGKSLPTGRSDRKIPRGWLLSIRYLFSRIGHRPGTWPMSTEPALREYTFAVHSRRFLDSSRLKHLKFSKRFREYISIQQS